MEILSGFVEDGYGVNYFTIEANDEELYLYVREEYMDGYDDISIYFNEYGNVYYDSLEDYKIGNSKNIPSIEQLLEIYRSQK